MKGGEKMSDWSALLLSIGVFAALFLVAAIVVFGGGLQTRPRRSKVNVDWSAETFQLWRRGAV